MTRFSDVLGNSSALLPNAVYERDPTVNCQVHKAILYTMATCHSLRDVDDELLGDPLDVKMFKFTGWSFKEFAQKPSVVDQENKPDRPLSTARSPQSLECGNEDLPQSATVRPTMT